MAEIRQIRSVTFRQLSPGQGAGLSSCSFDRRSLVLGSYAEFLGGADASGSRPSFRFTECVELLTASSTFIPMSKQDSVRKTRPRDQSTGRLLFAIGITGLVLSLVAGVAGWVLVDAAVDSISDTLALSDDALVSLADTIDVASDVLEATGGGLEAVQLAMADLDIALGTTAEVLTEFDTILAETVPAGIDALQGPLGTLATTTGVIADVLSGLAFFGIDFQPDTAPDESIADIRAELTELSAQLRRPEARLGRVADDLNAVTSNLVTVETQLAELVGSVGEADTILSDYQSTTNQALELIAAAQADLDQRRILARMLVLLVAALFIVGQAVPIVLGRRMMADGPPIQ